jgi:PAS domain S-box-containing protein
MTLKEITKKLKPERLRYQLILGIAIVNVVLMSLFVMEQMDRQKAFFLELNHDRTVGLSINLANTANSYVISLELARLQKLVSTYKDIPGTEYAFVTSDDGTVLAHTNEKFLGLKASDPVSAKLKPVNATQVLLEDNNILDIATPILNHNEIVGWARIGVSQRFIEPSLTAIKRRGLLYILISLIVGSIFAVIVAGGLSRGLQKLITAAEKIKAGNRDLRVEPSRSEEITQLGTAFNQMLDEISANEKLLSSVLQNLPVGVWILDDKGEIISCNPAGDELWKGVKHVGVDEYHAYKAWFTETGMEVQNHEWGAAKVLAHGRPVLNQEMEIECFDRSRKTVLNSAIPLRDHNEKLAGVIAINVDITERKKAEQKLKERESQLTTIFDNVQCSLGLIDANGKMVLFNSRFSENYKFLTTHEPQVGEIVYDFFTEEMKAISKLMDSALSGNKEVFQNDYLSSGKVARLRTSYDPVISDGKVTGVITSSFDLTKDREAEIKLKESEEKYRYLFNNNPAFLIIWDLESLQVTEVSDTVVAEYGYTREEWIGMSVLQYRPKEDHEKIIGLAKDMLIGDYEPVAHMAWRHIKKDGEEMQMEISSHKIIYNGRPCILSLGNDVTERLKAEEEKKKSEQNYRSLFEQASDVILLTDLTGNILAVNPSGSELLGYTREEMIGKNTGVFIDPLQLQNEPLTIPQLVEGQQIIRRRKATKKTGEIVELESNSKRIFGDRILVIARDITELRKAERQIAASEERNRALIENINDAIMLLDENFENIYQSPSVERIVGYVMDDGSSKLATDFIHPDDLPVGVEFFQNAMQSPGVAFQSQFRVRHKDGHYIWIEGTVMNLLHNKSVKAFIVNYRDITERKKAEEQQALITSIVNSSDDAIISKTLDGRISSWNHGAEIILGYTAEEVLGKHISKLIPGDMEGEESLILNKIREGQSVDHYETRRVRKDGKEIYASLTVSPIRDSLGNIVGASKILRDITDRKKAEEEIKTLNETLEQKVVDRTSELLEANKALEAFSYSVTHDLRAPLRSVIGFTKIIEKEYQPSFNDDLKELFGFIGSSTKRMNAIIDDLLALAKYEKAQLRSAPVDMDKLMTNVWDNIQFSSPHSATLQMEPLPGAVGDESLLEQVLVNLLSNAVKYSSKKEKPVITVTSEKSDSVITYRVKDNGAGFDMKNYDRLFGAFQRLHGMSEFEGTGVGLLLVKRIVERHGGVVWAESKVDEGATFYFTLPGSN